MAASAMYSNASVSWGLIGTMQKVPQYFKYSTILFYGNQGVRQVRKDVCAPRF